MHVLALRRINSNSKDLELLDKWFPCELQSLIKHMTVTSMLFGCGCRMVYFNLSCSFYQNFKNVYIFIYCSGKHVNM